jgi:hypothetical protein
VTPLLASILWRLARRLQNSTSSCIHDPSLPPPKEIGYNPFGWPGFIFLPILHIAFAYHRGTYNPFKARHDFTKTNKTSTNPRPFEVPPAVATTTPKNNIAKAIKIERKTQSRPLYLKPTSLRGPL